MSRIESEFSVIAGRLRADEAESLVRQLNAHVGSEFTFVGMAELGETNAAAYVQWPDGRGGVLTRTRHPIEQLARTAETLEFVRAAGIPVPRYELIVQVREWTVVVQERLPGAPPAGRRIDVPMMDAILVVAESFAGLLIDRTDVPTVPMRLATDVTAAGVSRYVALERYDDRTRQLFARIRDIHQSSDQSVTGHDLVHRDFAPPNILFDETGNPTGVVDWHDHTLVRGDRRYSLISLRFELGWGIAAGWTTVDPAALRRLDEALDSLDPATLRLYWTQPSLGLLYEMIHEARHADVDLLLAVAWSRLG